MESWLYLVLVRLLATQLWRAIVWRANAGASKVQGVIKCLEGVGAGYWGSRGKGLLCAYLCNAKVSQLDGALCGQEDVAWL